MINIVNILIIFNTPATNGYEFSIYDVYPWYLWFLFGLTIFTSSSLLLINALFFRQRETFWTLGFIILFISYIPFLFLTAIRNYLMYGREDPLSHVGFIHDIVSTGHIFSNMYPISHILFASLSLIFSMKEMQTLTIFYGLIPIISFITTYPLYKNILSEKNYIFIAFALNFLASLHSQQFFPSTFANFFIPLTLYLCLRSYSLSNVWKYKLLLIITLFFVAFSHALVSLILIVIFLLLDTSNFINNWGTWHVRKINLFTKNISLLNIILVLTWGSWVYTFVFSLMMIFNFISDESIKSDYANYSDLVDKFSPGISDMIWYFISIYGRCVLILTLGIIAIAYLYYLTRFKRIVTTSNEIFFTSVFIFFCVSSIIAFIIPFGFNFDRLLAYPIMISFILIPKSIMFIFESDSNCLKIVSVRNMRQILIYVFIAIIIATLVYLCTYTFFDSVRTRSTNPQVTDGELKGITMFFSSRNDSLQIRNLGINQLRFFEAIYGRDKPKNNIRYSNTNLINHFGYNKNITQRYFYRVDTYILISTLLGRGSDQAIMPEYEFKWRFIPRDFAMMNNDSSVYEIYTNKDFETYLVKSS